LNYVNTIIANSTAGGDCANASIIGTHTNNLVEDGSCSATFSGDPLLGALANNGPSIGSGQATLTHALLPGSPAIDAGDDASCLPTDQRGIPRPQGAHCDIGAYEAATLWLLKTVTPETDVAYHGVVTYTVVLGNASEVNDTSVVLTDTLPAGVSFGQWVAAPPGGLIQNGNALTWTGTLTRHTAITFNFTATHMGGYGDVIANTAYFSGTLEKGHDSAVFSVECDATVQNANDSGPGSLRQAIADVCANGRIDFADNLAGQTITLGSSLDLARNLTIDGSSLAAPVQISGNNAVRGFNVTGSAHITLDSLRIIWGRNATFNVDCRDESCGGGIKIDAGAVVTLAHSAVLTSTATFGGGIYNQGTLTVQNSSLAGDSADWDGGGIYNQGTLTVQNSTLAGNSATGGGGIYNLGTLTVQNSTLAGNSADSSGGGIYNWGTLYYANTIIANSPDGGDCYGGTIGTNIRNLVEDGSCSAALSGDPLLGALADNGGGTATMPLLPGSPAIDAGDDAGCLATDQRGAPRADLRCDIGAFELQHADSDTVIKTFGDATTHSFGPTWVSVTLLLTDTGALTITKHLVCPGGTCDGGELPATWYITSTLSVGLPLTVSFCYTGELAAVTNEGNLRVFRWNTTAMTWTLPISTGLMVDTINHCVILTGIEEFSAWTLKDTSVGAATPTAAHVVGLAARGGTSHKGWLLLALGGAVAWRRKRRPS